MLTAGQKAVLAALKASGLPITRENYLAFDYGDDLPDPWTAEDEELLPEFLQEGYEEAVADAGPEDEPRDESGRWTTGGGVPAERNADDAVAERNKNDPHYAHDVHSDLMFVASKDRYFSMGAANYVYMVDTHWGTPRFDEFFAGQTKPFEKRNYPSKGAPGWHAAIAEAREQWRSDRRID